MCELPDGSRAVLPVWMLDRAACQQVTLGAPQCSVAALRDLRRLLDALALEGDPVIALSSSSEEEAYA